jgi:hypothetical protein
MKLLDKYLLPVAVAVTTGFVALVFQVAEATLLSF